MARVRDCSGFSTRPDSQLAPVRDSTVMAREASAESWSVTVAETGLSPDGRRVTPAANFTLAVPEARKVPSQKSPKVALFSVAGRASLAVAGAVLPGFRCEISYFHSVTLKPIEPLGE